MGVLRGLRGPRSVRSYSIDELRLHHSNGDAVETLHTDAGQQYVGDFVYGAIDGVVTTFAIVAGIAGADLSANVVLILGIANLLADGFAMGVGNYLSIKSEHERYKHEWEEEMYEIETIPEHERKEIETIYRNKGLQETVLQSVVHAITADKEQWVREMLHEEHGLSAETRSPFIGGFTTYTSFVIIGTVPLVSFAAALFVPDLAPRAFLLSNILTGFALFGIGVLKTFIVARPVMRAGLETLLMGSLAAGVAYGVGFILKGIV